MQYFEDAVSHTYARERTNWYAPALGLVIKNKSIVTKGTNYGKTWKYQLLNILYPSEAIKQAHEKSGKKGPVKSAKPRDTAMDAKDLPADLAAKLKLLKEMYRDGDISKQQYEKKRDGILSQLK